MPFEGGTISATVIAKDQFVALDFGDNMFLAESLCLLIVLFGTRPKPS